MAGQKKIEVEVVFALAERQELVALAIAAGATVAEAIDQSGIAKRFPEQDLSACTPGIWGRVADSNQVLQGGDRVEIYRPLNIDPRETRRQLAAEGKSMGQLHSDADKD
jgi:putative ubiquitin-RnfH superfamily antitoxin RatB of RatAB toxin-antitoxin module